MSIAGCSLKQLLVVDSLAQRASVVILAPLLDALTVEVVAFVAG